MVVFLRSWMYLNLHYWSPFNANDCVFSRIEQQKVYRGSYVNHLALFKYANDSTIIGPVWTETNRMHLQFVFLSTISSTPFLKNSYWPQQYTFSEKTWENAAQGKGKEDSTSITFRLLSNFLVLILISPPLPLGSPLFLRPKFLELFSQDLESFQLCRPPSVSPFHSPELPHR